MNTRWCCAVLASVLSGPAHAAVVDPPPPDLRKAARPDADPAALETLARDTFERLKPLFPSGRPDPRLVVSPSGLVDAKADARGTITLTRGLLKLCARAPTRGSAHNGVTLTRIAFVLSHELAHVAHGHPGLFGPGVEPAVEESADAEAVGALLVAGYDADQLGLADLLRGIARARGITDPTVPKRVRQVRESVRVGEEHAADWRLGWLLSVSGRFEEARDFYRSFAAKYPLPAATNAHAHTRVLAAWRVHPCSDPTVLEWSVPLRYDPRSQLVPFKVRSFDDSCTAFTAEIRGAIEDLKKAPDYPPARVAVGALRLMLNDPSLDPTSKDGGVPRMGTTCPPPASDGPADDRLRADACQVSLLAQYEMSARTSAARQSAIDGLRALRDRWPDEPSLRFNLARLLTHAGQAGEAEPLWRAFVREAAEGPYRDEAMAQLHRVAPSPAADPDHADGLEPRAAEGTATAVRPSPLAVAAPPCKKPMSGVAVSAAPQRPLRRCGSWGDELVVRNNHGVLVRSVSASSSFWPGTRPPSGAPILVAHDVTGDVVRVWDQEAWVFNAGAPTRVVYFKRAP